MSLILKNVSKKFDNSDDYILKNINLEIKDEEFVCVIGHSGCGKSTLLNIIAGLERPTEGEIYLDENIITKPGKDRIVMFQESSLFPWLSVIENVKFGMNIAGISKEEQEEKAVKYLKLVQLLKFKDYRIHELSGGMKQRIELARALTLDSKVLLMDEPFASLDKQTINMLREEIQNIWLQTKRTVLFITHSVEEALFFADRIIMISSIEKGIKKIFNIDIERPRHIESKEFIDLRVNILNEFKQEVKKIEQREHD